MRLSDLKLSTRISLAFIALVVALGVLFLFVAERERQKAVVADYAQHVEHNLDLHAAAIRRSVETLRQDVSFLAQLPPVAGIVRASQNQGKDPIHSNTLGVWRQRLSEIFLAYAESHPHYFEIRFIGIDDGGRELVRIDRFSGSPTVVPDSGLQRKGNRYYFTAASRLDPRGVYLSEIDLNRENDKIAEPRMRTLRAATPVFDARGLLFGIVVVNLDFGAFLDAMIYDMTPLPGLQSYVADRHGNFLLHPDARQEFAFETGSSARLDDEFPVMSDISSLTGRSRIGLQSLPGAEGASWLAARRVGYDPARPENFVSLLHALPDMAITAEVARHRTESRTLLMLAVFAVIGCLLLGLRLMMRPLAKLTAAAEAIAAGRRDIVLPEISPHGDIAMLTRAFWHMQAQVVEREEYLEGQIRQRTAHLKLAKSVFDHTSEGVVIGDEDGKILSVNPAFTAITGYTAEEAVGQSTRLLKSDRHDVEFYRRMWADLHEFSHWQGEIWNRRKSGEAYLEWLAINKVTADDDSGACYVAVFNDITELQRKDERIRHLAYHDALTGLPNRTLLIDRLQHAIARARRESSRLALMFIDLDRFKIINDTQGHEIGDLLLIEVAKRFKDKLRATDTVARMGGDEFLVLLENVSSESMAADIAADLIRTASEEIEIAGNRVRVGASVGIVLSPDDGIEASELMKHADTAMYAAKTAGRNTFRFFRSEMTEAATRRHETETELRHAIEHDQLELHYQPKVCLSSGQVLGVEALLRWRHPERGLVPPDEFIPIAEETDLILSLGKWVLHEACDQIVDWKLRGLDLQVAVNLSARQLQRGDLVEQVRSLAACRRIAPHALQLEVTESVVMTHPEQACRQLQQLREMGMSIAMDDFGTGYSSLSHLRQLPIDILKIDRSFVMDADRDEEDATLVRSILALAKALNLVTVAEGVENKAQAALLRQAGCDFGQGYLFSRPLPADQLENWLAGRHLRPHLVRVCSHPLNEDTLPTVAVERQLTL
jgi:diguanylate cyclase (GGDEF)-like protein/PAS domain S-box-containing protein